MFGCEVCTISNHTQKKQGATEILFMRRMLRTTETESKLCACVCGREGGGRMSANIHDNDDSLPSTCFTDSPQYSHVCSSVCLSCSSLKVVFSIFYQSKSSISEVILCT